VKKVKLYKYTKYSLIVFFPLLLSPLLSFLRLFSEDAPSPLCAICYTFSLNRRKQIGREISKYLTKSIRKSNMCLFKNDMPQKNFKISKNLASEIK